MSYVLIIEDNQVIGDLLTNFTRLLGFDSFYLQNFSEFTPEHLEQATHIILDLNMPDVDGIDVIETLSARNVTTPIILCSGVSPDVFDSAVEVLQESGLVFGGSLRKPFTLQEVEKLLRAKALQKVEAITTDQPNRAVSFNRAELVLAIKKNWFYPVFQPQIDVSNNTLFGVECLARLDHPLFGQCFPDTFIPKLVEFDLIDEFTIHFIAQTLQVLAKATFPVSARISFNLDPHSLTKKFLGQVLTKVAEISIEPQQICLEVTELSEVDLSNDLKSIITKLRVQGFHISLDDFGTGFATIHELDNLPFNEIKIDRSFVSHMLEKQSTLAIIKHTIGLAKDMDLLVIAEGVETLAQAVYLRDLGCKYMQGYYFAKPLSISSLSAMLSKDLIGPDLQSIQMMDVNHAK